MRINLSTVFQVLALIAQDVLAFEKQQNSNPSVRTPETQATDNQPPA